VVAASFLRLRSSGIVIPQTVCREFVELSGCEGSMELESLRRRGRDSNYY